jgi:hypothetical protein
MSGVNDCLKHIIGLSQTNCDCWDTGKPSDFNESDSEIYLTDLEPLASLEGLVNCENGTIWDVLEQSRDEAIKRFLGDANGLLLQKYQLKRQPYTGKIGETTTRQVKSLTHTYGGATMYCADIISGSLTINAIGTLFENDGTVDVTVVDNLGNTYGTYSLNTTAMKYCNNTITPLDLELHTEEIRHIQYFFYYTYDSNNKPLRNRLHCNCGAFKPIWNYGKPYFNDSSIEPRYNWAKYMMVGGFEENDLTDLSDPDKTIFASGDLNGLTFDVNLKCKTQEVFCKDSLNYESNPLANAMAFAIRFKAAHILFNKLLTTPELTRENMIGRESMIEFTKQWDVDYQNYLGYVVQNVYIKTNDCFECKDIIKAMKAGIFA